MTCSQNEPTDFVASKSNRKRIDYRTRRNRTMQRNIAWRSIIDDVTTEYLLWQYERDCPEMKVAAPANPLDEGEDVDGTGYSIIINDDGGSDEQQLSTYTMEVVDHFGASYVCWGGEHMSNDKLQNEVIAHMNTTGRSRIST